METMSLRVQEMCGKRLKKVSVWWCGWNGKKWNIEKDRDGKDREKAITE